MVCSSLDLADYIPVVSFNMLLCLYVLSGDSGT